MTTGTKPTTAVKPVTAIGTTTTTKKERISEQPGQAQSTTPAGRFAIGLDLGDRSTAFCVLDTGAAIGAEGKLKSSRRRERQLTNRSRAVTAQTLARLARFDLQLLELIRHRTAPTQADLATIRARETLVTARGPNA